MTVFETIIVQINEALGGVLHMGSSSLASLLVG